MTTKPLVVTLDLCVSLCQVMSAVLPRSYAEKVVLLDKNEDLLQYIEADQLHVNYGGNNP
jgi:hypothetical protein